MDTVAAAGRLPEPVAGALAARKWGALAALDCDHLVVGAGLLGLATADHLLRGGAEKVLLLEKSPSPSGMRGSLRAPFLAPRRGSWDELVRRGRILIEGWPDYLESDPGFQRGGSLRFPATDAAGGEVLAAEDIERRWPVISGADGKAAILDPADGNLDAVEMVAALVSQVLGRGGQIIGDCEILSLEEHDDGVLFKSSGRQGKAKQVLLAAGVGNLPILEALGVRHRLEAENWHAFHLQAAEELPGIIWFPDSGAILQQTVDGEMVLEVVSPVTDGSPQGVPVDWSLLEDVRGRYGEWLPALTESAALRGAAGVRLALGRGPEYPKSHGGRVVAAGGFGCHGPLLAIASAEEFAKVALEGGGGLLEYI